MKPERLYTLDAMRGLAALLVLIYHLSDKTFRVAPAGYLAVDFFFALSGLVLAQAYSEPLTRGLGVRDFMLKRFIRVYPMFMLGVGFAVVKALGQLVMGDLNALSPAALAGSLVLEAFMLPSPFGQPDLFPLNGPGWSLFFELVINAAFAIWLVKLNSRTLVAIALIAAVAVAAAAFSTGRLNVGWSWGNAWGGLARVTFAFIVGILVFRADFKPRVAGLACVIPTVLLVFVMVIPIAPHVRPGFDTAVALIGPPALLILGASFQPSAWMRGACEALGDLSYPLYAIHFPLMVIAAYAAKRAGVNTWLWAPAFIVGMAATAWLLGRTVDPWARGWLTRIAMSRPRRA